MYGKGQYRIPSREGTEQGEEVRRLACEAWERHKEGADMRLEDTKGELRLCLLSLFCECAYGYSVVVSLSNPNQKLASTLAKT